MDTSVERWNSDYQLAAEEARASPNWQIDVHAALLAPASFLARPDDFEFTIQLVVYHLSQAVAKTNGDAVAASGVRRMAEELINFHAYVVERRIKIAIERNKHKLLTALADFFAEAPGAAVQAAIDAALGLYPSVSGIASELRDLYRAFVEFFFFRWKVKEQEKYFSEQLGKVLQRSLEIPLLGERSELIADAFARSQSHVLPAAVQDKGLLWTMNLLRFDRSPAALQESLRILVQELAKTSSTHGMLVLFSSPYMNMTLDSTELEALARKLHWSRLSEKISEQMVGAFFGSGCLTPVLFVVVWAASRQFTEAAAICLVVGLAVLSFPALKGLAAASALRSHLSEARVRRTVQGRQQLGL